MEIRVHANTEYELEKLLWGNGLRVFSFVRSMGYGEELLNELEETFSETPEIVTINDYLAYVLNEYKFVATHIWAGEVTDIESLIKYADDLGYYDAYKVIREVINVGKAESLWKLVENYGGSLDELFEEIVCLDIDNL